MTTVDHGTPRPGTSGAGVGRADAATSSEGDWTDQVTSLVVESVDKVRDRTTGPILEYSRISVHAVVAMILTIPVLILVTLGLIRLLTWAVDEAWLSYTIIGTVFVLIGVVLWSRRSKLPI